MLNILFIDDQALKLGDALEEMLNAGSDEREYEVRSTTDPEEALTAADVDIAIVGLDLTGEGPPAPENFLTDIQEEHLGYKLLAHFRRIRPRAKVIILASYAMCEEHPEEKPVALEKGADGFLSKPFTVEELIREIERISGEGSG